MKILINDANILIDLVKLDLLEQFVKLSHDLHTTDFILEEVNKEQKEEISKYIDLVFQKFDSLFSLLICH